MASIKFVGKYYCRLKNKNKNFEFYFQKHEKKKRVYKYFRI